MTRLVALVFVLAGTIGTASANRRGEVSAADAQRILFVFNQVADVMVAHPTNCPRLAAEIDRIVDANQASIRRAATAKEGGKRLPKAVQEKMLARVGGMLPAMENCGTNQAVMDAMQRLDGKSDLARGRTDGASAREAPARKRARARADRPALTGADRR